MTLGVLGDIHGEFETAWRIVRQHPEVPAWLCVGDLGNDRIRESPPPAPFYLTKGNNEDFEFLARVTRRDVVVPNLLVLANGVLTDVGGCRLVSLGGTFAPTWYETPAAELPYPGSPHAGRQVKDDKRRHFVHEEVEACKQLRDVDLFVTHEAPRPYIVAGNDAGKTPINEILAALKPRLHFFGHHHRFLASTRQGVPSVGLDLVTRSYVLVDTGAWTYERRDLQ